MRSVWFLSLGAALVLGSVASSATASAEPGDHCGGATFAQDMVAAHNKFRAEHGSPPLTLDERVSGVAQDYANRLASSGILEHSGGPYGENLYMAEGMEVTGATAVEDWYAEIKDYNFSKPGFSERTGHFTQVVWKSSKQLGVGIACNGSKTYVVALYNLPGNYEGEFPGNVLQTDSSVHR